MRVLVVDDNTTNLRILGETLTRWGMMACLSEDGMSALRELQLAYEQGHPFAMVLTDAHMPQMDGFELVERIKRDRRFTNTSMVMLTSAGEPGDATRCRQLQVADVPHQARPANAAPGCFAKGDGLEPPGRK